MVKGLNTASQFSCDQESKNWLCAFVASEPISSFHSVDTKSETPFQQPNLKEEVPIFLAKVLTAVLDGGVRRPMNQENGILKAKEKMAFFTSLVKGLKGIAFW